MAPPVAAEASWGRVAAAAAAGQWCHRQYCQQHPLHRLYPRHSNKEEEEECLCHWQWEPPPRLRPSRLRRRPHRTTMLTIITFLPWCTRRIIIGVLVGLDHPRLRISINSSSSSNNILLDVSPHRYQKRGEQHHYLKVYGLAYSIIYPFSH